MAQSHKNKFSPPGISIWVTIFLWIEIAFGFVLGIPALFGSGLMETHTIGWDGRELGDGVGALVAAFLRDAAACLVIFLAGVFRELSDALEAFAEKPDNFVSAGGVSVFMFIGALCALASYCALRFNGIIRGSEI
ncbi:hypothetical protein [uncultured Tateyamaria sp.]|uniref:hypothetical protein n=1 Tax=uncultured Tateyamaria sp. TaxID=455651 RepID=UPI00261014D2|nr:hypothetical protein [uncultured Tateyamaria sp.]